VLLAAASLWARRQAVHDAGSGETFVNRDQLARDAGVRSNVAVRVHTWLGLYVASFILIAGFMWIVGGSLWKSLLAFLFSVIMFVTFDIAFDVIMPKGPLEAAFGH
jgi:hypothetical protein